MRNGRGGSAVRHLLVGLRLIQLFQRCWEGVRDATLDCPHGLRGDDDRRHLRLPQLLVQLAGTVKIDLRSPVALLTTQPEPTLASKKGQCRLINAWKIIGEECLRGTEGFSEASLALQGDHSIQ